MEIVSQSPQSSTPAVLSTPLLDSSSVHPPTARPEQLAPEVGRPGQPPSVRSFPAARLDPVGCVPDEKNWSDVAKGLSLRMTHSFTPLVEQLYQSDVRKQGPLFEPSISSAVYFLVHTAPAHHDPLEVLIYNSASDTSPIAVPMVRLENGHYFVGIDDEGKTIGEGTRFAYRNKTTGAIIADPNAFELTPFEWKKVPNLGEMPNQSHFKPIQCIVRQDPLVSAVRELGRDIAPAPEHEDIRTVKFNVLRTSDLSDEQLGAGFEGTQGTLKALQSPFVQREMLKGFNRVEFFPIHSFGTEVPTFYADGKLNPDAQNVWGYMPISHFSIDPSRVHDKGNPWSEVIETIDSLHRAGFRVAVDVVPHSFEAADDRPCKSEDFKGPSLNFRELDREGYYAIFNDGRLRNYSGCGNAFRFVPVIGRHYEPNSLESQVGEGGAYFLRSIENIFRLGADVRIDQGILLGRNEWGEFFPQSWAFCVLSRLANTYGSRVVCESSDCGKDGPGSSDWIKVEPYAATEPVHPSAKIRTQDFGAREITRNAMADFAVGMIREVANVLNGHGVSYAGAGRLSDSYRVVPVSPHDGWTLYDDMKLRLEKSRFRDQYFSNSKETLLAESEKKLPSEQQEKLIERRLVSTAALGVEFLTTFSPTTDRLWNYGAQFLADQKGNHDAYDVPEFSNKSLTSVEPWRKEYGKIWIEKEELREELGVFSHARFLGHPSLQYFDGSGQSMNRGYEHEVNARWGAGHSPQILSAWYSGQKFEKPDVLVMWCSGRKDNPKEPVKLPKLDEKSEAGEQYVWLRRADSSALIALEDDKRVFEPVIVEPSQGVLFKTGGVQVFQRVTEREARNKIAKYWEERGQA